VRHLLSCAARGDSGRRPQAGPHLNGGVEEVRTRGTREDKCCHIGPERRHGGGGGAPVHFRLTSRGR